MKILTLNIGSSSIKYSLFDNEQILTKREITNIKENQEWAVKKIMRELKDENIQAIVHRVTHGGKIKESKKIDSIILNEIKKTSDLAPLHNPIQIKGIHACMKLMPKIPQVAVFDTAFHQTIPEKAYTYALPAKLCKKHSIRKYGFHGTSHQYIATQTKGKTISCHLGNGCSITAIIDGKSIDTSMGFTPTEGLVMGTRSGDIDPEIIAYLIEKEKINSKEIRDLLNKKSGLLGISKKTSNMKDLLQDSSPEANLAIDVFVYRLTKYIGSYVAAMNGANEIVFTAGIGENSHEIRKRVCANLTYLGVEIDDAKNRSNQDTISTNNSKIKIRAIKTDEELMMAREAMRILNN